MDLSTTYLGFHLPHPLMPGASPLVDDLDTVRRLEDAGAAAIVMHSLFEEQIAAEAEVAFGLAAHADSSPEATSYFPRPHEFPLGPDQYLEQIRRIRTAVAVPVIASLNGATASGWLDYARLIEQAGAHALELNVWAPATDPRDSAATVEARLLQIVASVRRTVAIPIAVKLSPYYSALAHLAAELDALEVGALVLFNRFYQPDIDVEALEIVPRLHLSEPYELLPRLAWLAVLSGHVRASLAVTGGVHGPLDAVKAVMAGAHAVQLVSALLTHGPGHLTHVRDGLATWLEEHEYDSLAQAQGSMNLVHCPDPGAFQRANYARVLQSWRR
ncbi:MAG: dihydroorotate dehydrogenase-like protein [Candidatus Binatia bacterium]